MQNMRGTDEMCSFVGIIVFQGVVEDVHVFDSKTKAIGWIAEKTNEYGIENCSDSLLWDVERRSRINLGFSLSR